MSYQGFSEKQRLAMVWWMPGSRHGDMEAIVCDGAVRSGKTLAMGMGFFLWAMVSFRDQRFGVCGKTIGSLRRNVLSEILPRLAGMGATWKERLKTPIQKEYFFHCRWESEKREHTRNGLTRVRTGIAMTREVVPIE